MLAQTKMREEGFAATGKATFLEAFGTSKRIRTNPQPFADLRFFPQFGPFPQHSALSPRLRS